MPRWKWLKSAFLSGKYGQIAAKLSVELKRLLGDKVNDLLHPATRGYPFVGLGSPLTLANLVGPFTAQKRLH
ncbi:hypothetical protein KOAAANKH_00220 [Brevundimonas sp. NIBR10]|nr:hypothetical protein KOAAANKH_00220 [Brevundimonas sp. NIBR10]